MFITNGKCLSVIYVFGKKSLLSKCRYSCGRMLILALRGHHGLLDAASVLHQRRPQEGPDDVGAFLRDGVAFVLVRLEETQRKVRVQVVRHRLVGHLPREPHAIADVVDQGNARLQTGILVERRQHLVGDLSLDVAHREPVGGFFEVLPDGPVQGGRRVIVRVQHVQRSAHLEHLALLQAVAGAER
uniref:(northern house mosquito) hypothetical protein n=1 Tax=Culex pipiens TaxID=7175 RepID=A0A8D8GI85_CULPI